MKPTVAQIINVMDQLAPPWLAEEWDNIGLQIGDPQWPVGSIWVALDPSLEVVKAACKHHVDLLITHHPLIFRPLKSIDFHSPIGAIIKMATKQQLAIFSAHTNLDIASSGVNDVLARKLELRHLEVLQPTKTQERFKLVVYAPVSAEQKLLKSLFQAKADPLNERSERLFSNSESGVFWMRTLGSFNGGHGPKIDDSEVARIEIVVDKTDLNRLLSYLKHHHAEETIACDVFPLISGEKGPGMGRIGFLEKPSSLKSLAMIIKEKLNLSFVKFAGDPELSVTQVALCAGSGSSLLQTFFSSDAQVYISGDLHYHDAKDAETASRGIIDVGHFPSEHLVVETLAQQLKKILMAEDLEIKIKACTFEKDPFIIL
jgi:dinuclear metal center YbgI/SA1388 family protein